MSNTRTKADMPLRGSKKAPKTFTGKPHRVKEFLENYEALLTPNNVTDQEDKYFQKIGGWLKLKAHITETEYLKAFWKDIPRQLQTRLEVEYYHQDATHQISAPFKVETLNASDSEDGADSYLNSSDSDSDMEDSNESNDKSDDDYKH
ncbi:hypothetical protein LXA43DRAFT_1068477 [Ganoderma leucocontextum]|nr:hypothetical protein LXA43DRAFT_1068477 [Ganoderma leucocontextum]